MTEKRTESQVYSAKDLNEPAIFQKFITAGKERFERSETVKLGRKGVSSAGNKGLTSQELIEKHQTSKPNSKVNTNKIISSTLSHE